MGRLEGSVGTTRILVSTYFVSGPALGVMTNTRETHNLPSTFRHRTAPRALGMSGLLLHLLVASAQSFHP